MKRREILMLAGTAAAFCTSFGFLQGGQTQHKNELTAVHKSELQRWSQAQIKWYAGSTLLHSEAIPAQVAKRLAADANEVVELKLFQSGRMVKNLGTIQGKF
ncbi:MAG: hypothetical protein ABFD52_01380 [Acidobacteriota bacterium]